MWLVGEASLVPLLAAFSTAGIMVEAGCQSDVRALVPEDSEGRHAENPGQQSVGGCPEFRGTSVAAR